MKSFGMWYKPKKGENNIAIDLHINLWNIQKYSEKEIEPFLDFGLSIDHFRDIEQLKILFPFSFTKSDFTDLYDVVKDPETAHHIFNDNSCETSSFRDNYSLKNTEDQKDKLLLKLFKKDNTNLIDSISINANDTTDSYTMLSISLSSISSDIDYQSLECLYLRFRLKTPALKRMLFCNLKKKNWFLESGFTSTQVVDLKINRKRNIPGDVCNKLRKEGFQIMSYNKIHFLIMDHANNDLSFLGNDFVECRKLEEDDWNTYLQDQYITNNVLVYHWKTTKPDNKPLNEYSKLIKITTATTSWKLISLYMLIVALLGTLGNVFFSPLNRYLFSPLWDKLLAIFTS